MNDADSDHDYLRKSSRRRILSLSAGALATGLAGCIGREADSDTTPTPTQTQTWDFEDTTGHTWIDDPFDELNTMRSSSGIEITGSGTIDSGMFTEQELDVDLPSEIEISVSTQGEKMDVHLLNRGQFNQYRDRGEIDFSDGLSVTNTDRIEESYQADPGDYNLVFDNSGVYGSQPEGPVQFEFQVTTSINNPLIENVEPPEIVESASQPRIVEVQDNLGHTIPTETGTIEDEVELSDDTVIRLNVTKIAAQNEDDITYSYDFLERTHRYNTNRYIGPSSWAWDLRREDYMSQLDFRIRIRNQDDIYYASQASEADDMLDASYSNLTLSK